ncbi:MAG TPA: DUF554 domain-containing protein [Bacillota bacterium]|nr:DUF554 domain-containing protein [Bacillota bacterium]HOL10123.1 DUF554 domain-containing protein [Bacillota bacterium]HPO97881.1 DUF554 domain-containing protein [Bacillota bacterium]
MGTIVNVITILIGGTIGLLMRNRFPERIAQTALQVMGLFTFLIGVGMGLKGNQQILVLISLALGAMLGEWIDIEGRLERFGVWLEQKLNVTEGSPSKGFIYASLVYCVGSMAIVGSIADGVKGDASILFTKSMMDGIISIPFAAGMGWGVLGSALPILIYQGGLTLLAVQLQPFFNDLIINELTAVGGVIVMGIGINILGIHKIKVGNFLPSLLIIVILMCLFS